MGEGRVEAEQSGEAAARVGGRRDAPPVEGGPFDRGGCGRDRRVADPRFAGGVELGGGEPVEQLAEAVGVVLAHT